MCSSALPGRMGSPATERPFKATPPYVVTIMAISITIEARQGAVGRATGWMDDRSGAIDHGRVRAFGRAIERRVVFPTRSHTVSSSNTVSFSNTLRHSYLLKNVRVSRHSHILKIVRMKNVAVPYPLATIRLT